MPEECTVAEVGRIVSPQGPLLGMHRNVCNGSIPLKKSVRGVEPLRAIIGRDEAQPPHAGFGIGIGISFASLRRFWAAAARWNSSRAPFGPRSRRRSSLRMRLRCANSISTFFRCAARGDVGVGGGDVAGHVAGALVDRAQDLAGRRVRAAARLESAGVAVELAGAVAHQPVLIDERARHPVDLLALPQLLAARTGVEIAPVVVGEVGPLEGAVAPLGLVEDRDVRLDPALVHQPGEHLGRAIGAVGGQPLRIEAEAILGALDHRARRTDLGLADRAARLDVHDDGVVHVDQVVGGVGEEGVPLQRAGPLRRRIGPRHELRLHLARRTPGGIVERVEILLHRATGLGHRLPVDRLRPFRRALLVGVGPDQAGIDREAFAADQPFLDAAAHRRLEQLAQQVAVAEAAVPVLREGRMVRNIALQAEPAEPAIGEVQMHLLAQPPLRADAEAVADDQHPDHQLRIDRGPPDLAVEGPQMRPQAGQVDEAVDRAQQVIGRNVALDAELVEQRLLHHRPLAHHRHAPPFTGGLNQDFKPPATPTFSTTIGRKQ